MLTLQQIIGKLEVIYNVMRLSETDRIEIQGVRLFSNSNHMPGILYISSFNALSGIPALGGQISLLCINDGPFPECLKENLSCNVYVVNDEIEIAGLVDSVFDILFESTAQKGLADLLRTLEKCTQLQELADVGCGFLGNPLMIADINHKILACTKSLQVSTYRWKMLMQAGFLPYFAASQPRMREDVQNSMEAALPIIVNHEDEDIRFIFKVIQVNTVPIGYLIIPGILKEPTASDIETAELISLFVMCELYKIGYSKIPGNAAFEYLATYLLDGKVMPDEMLKNRLKAINWRLKEYCYVFVVRSFERDVTRASFEDIIKNLPRQENDRILYYDNDIVLIISRGNSIGNTDEISELLGYFTHYGLSAGVSRSFDRLNDLRSSYLQAVEVLQAGARLGIRKKILFYDECLIYYVLEYCGKAADIKQFCLPEIFRAAKAENLHSAEYLLTLELYLENEKSFVKVANIINTHPNTVKYRINKCAKMYHLDLDNGANLINILLSLKILRYLSMNGEDK